MDGLNQGPISTLGWYATCPLSSPKEMDVKIVFRHFKPKLPLDSSERDAPSFFFYVEIFQNKIPLQYSNGKIK